MQKKLPGYPNFTSRPAGKSALPRRLEAGREDSRESMCQKSWVTSIFGQVTRFFGTDFAIIANIIRIFGPDSRTDSSEGNLNRGFSMKSYPHFYFPNIIPALLGLRNATICVVSWSAVWLSFLRDEACSLEMPQKCCVLGHNASHFFARSLLVLQANGGKVGESEEKCAVAAAALARRRWQWRQQHGGSAGGPATAVAA